MNRTEARKRIEQILEWVNAMKVDGRCPKCEAIGQIGGPVPMPEVPLSAADQRHLQEQPLHGVQFNHREGCPMNEDMKDAARLLVRFKLFQSLKYDEVQSERGPVLVFRLATEETDD